MLENSEQQFCEEIPLLSLHSTSTAPAWPVVAGLQCLQWRLQCCMILHDLNTTQCAVCFSLSGFVVLIFTSKYLDVVWRRSWPSDIWSAWSGQGPYTLHSTVRGLQLYKCWPLQWTELANFVPGGEQWRQWSRPETVMTMDTAHRDTKGHYVNQTAHAFHNKIVWCLCWNAHGTEQYMHILASVKM